MPGGCNIDPAKAAAALNLAEAGYTPTQISRETGVSQPSISGILHRHGRWGEVTKLPVFNELRREQNLHLEAAFRAGAAQLLGRAFDESKLEKASTYQLVIASSIALDKSRLLAGESTENVAVLVRHELSTEDALLKRLASTLLPEPEPQAASGERQKADPYQGEGRGQGRSVQPRGKEGEREGTKG